MEQMLVPTVGRYEVQRQIGEGGMAQVFRCLQRGPGGFEKRVVLKVLHPHLLKDPDHVKMFVEEARLLARLHHPNIIQIIEFACVDTTPYLVMEYVDGPTLAQLYKRATPQNPVHLAQLLQIVSQVCRGLHHAHGLAVDGVDSGLVHRDISSQNILVDAHTGTAKLIDFGIARIDEHAPTRTGVLKGKVHYLAPEVLSGQRADARADIFAVGVLLYRIVTGRMPVMEGESVWVSRAAGRYPSVESLAPFASAELVAIIDRALHPKPKHRYQTAEALAIELDAEYRRLGRPSGAPQWIQQLFPEGDEAWTGGNSVSSAQTSLNQIATGVSEDPDPRPMRDLSIVLALAAAIMLVVGVAPIFAIASAYWMKAALDPAPASVEHVERIDPRTLLPPLPERPAAPSAPAPTTAPSESIPEPPAATEVAPEPAAIPPAASTFAGIPLRDSMRSSDLEPFARPPEPIPEPPAAIEVAPEPTPAWEPPPALPAPSVVRDADALHQALAPVVDALIRDGLEAEVARSVISDLEASSAAPLAEGRALQVDPRQILSYVSKSAALGLDRKTISKRLREAFFSGVLGG